MNRTIGTLSAVLLISCVVGYSQETTSQSVPHLVRFAGTVVNADRAARDARPSASLSRSTRSRAAALHFGRKYKTLRWTPPASTAWCWAPSKDGIPAELFAAGEAHWLGVQVEQEPEFCWSACPTP